MTYPPTPFPWKGVTVGSLRSQFIDMLPPWGGPTEAS